MNDLKEIDLWVQGTSWVSLALSGCGVCWILFTARHGVVESSPAILVFLASIAQEAFLIFLVGVAALLWKRADQQTMPPRVILWYLLAVLVPIIEFAILSFFPATSQH